MSNDMAAVKRLHDAANDPTYSSPRVRRADVQVVVRLVDAQAARLAAARNALVVLYELNEAGNVGGAVYEEAMDLAMDVLRDTETATGAVGAGEGHDGD